MILFRDILKEYYKKLAKESDYTEDEITEAYRWRPSKTQRQAFAKNMQDPSYAAEYYARKEAKAEKKRATSKFDYTIAGGAYIPQEYQYDAAMRFLSTKHDMTDEQKRACELVVSAYSMNEKVHHDYIHIVNDMYRSEQAIDIG